MYQNAALLAAVVLIYSAVAGRVARSWLSGPILFTAAGLIVGPLGLDVLHLDIAATDLKVLAEAALAMVLFTDAAHADLGVVRRTVGLPERLLLIGLPLTIVLGFLAALLLFPTLDLFAAALLAALLAPTDAALGAPVVTNEAVPAETREALNLESGLNDGICVPVVIILLDLAIGTEIERTARSARGRGHRGGNWHWPVCRASCWPPSLWRSCGSRRARIGSARTGDRFRLSRWRAFVSRRPRRSAAAASSPASSAGCCSATSHDRPKAMLGGAASTGEVLAMMTWVVFGGRSSGGLLDRVTWSMLIYAVLSLTVIRIVPVALSLLGTGMSRGTKLFIGWFGPRGLASIVFAVIVFDADVPGKETLVVTAACTVLLSIIAHGVTANPLIAVLRRERISHKD